MIESPYLTHDEAAAYLKITPNLFKRNFAAKIKKTLLSNKEVRFKPEHIDEFVTGIQAVERAKKEHIKRSTRGTFATKNTAA